MHKIDIQYFEEIYHLHLINIVGSISLSAALLSYVHYGIHHHSMETGLERLGLQKSLSSKIYLGMLFSPGAH